MEKAASGSRPFFFLSLRSKPLEILLDLTAFCTCYTPLAANRGSRRIPMLRSKPLEILLDLTAFRTCYTPLAANRGSRRIPMDYGRCAPKALLAIPISRAKLLEVPRVGGLSLGQNGHGFTVGLRPNPGKQGVDAIEAF
jgi:hypothetical protein